VLTRLDVIDGIESSVALLANDGKRMVQIRMRPGAKVTRVVEEVQRALRAAIQEKTPVQLEDKAADALGPNQDWLTIGQLKELAATEASSSRKGYWLLALVVLAALGAFLIWRRRRQKSVRQRSGVRLNSRGLRIAAS
jgi:hypothetical protein